LLRGKFNSGTTDATLQQDYVNDANIHKILMLHVPSLEIHAAVLYQEDKKMGNNLCKIQLFCSKDANRGLGSRLMVNTIHYMTNKKFYCEVLVEADITAVNFFLNFEFVLIEFNDLPD
jgi:predicted GNAT family N-acyltransferase